MPNTSDSPFPAQLFRAALAAWSALTVAWLLVPLLERQFRDYGVELSEATLLVINTSRWLRGGNVGQEIPGMLIVAVPWLAIAVIPVLLAAQGASRRAGVLLLWALFFAGSIGTLLMIVAFSLPIRTIYQSVQGGAGI